MKIRMSLVSNSSSSSFIVVTKGITNWIENTEKVFKISKDSPFFNIAQEVGSVLSSGKFFDSWESFCKYLVDEEYWKNDKEVTTHFKKVKELFDKGFDKVIYGSAASDDCDEVESLVCHMNIHYESENLYIDKDGGY